MRRTLFIVLFLSFLFQKSSASQNLDSLNQAFLHARTDSAKLTVLLALTRELLNSQNKNTLDYLQKAKKLAEKIPVSRQHAVLWLRYGRYHSFAGDYEKAAADYLKAIRLAERAGDFQTVEDARNNLAVLNMQIKNFDRGIAEFKKLLEMAKKRGDRETTTQYLLNLAIAYGEKGDENIAEKYLRMVYSSETDKLFYKVVAANNLSFIYNNTKHFKKAEKYAREAVSAYPRLKSLQPYLQSLANLTHALVGQKKFAQAEPVARKIVRLARENGFRQEMMDGIGDLASVYKGLGNFEKALHFYDQYTSLKDSLLNEKTTEQINELQIKYETEKKEKELALKSEQLRLEKIKLRFFVAALLGTVSFLLVTLHFYRKRSVAYKELVRKNLELIRSEKRIEELQEKEQSTGKEPGCVVEQIPADKKSELLNELERKLIQEKKYLQSNLTLEKLASEMEISSKYLSALVHWHYQTTFPNFINQLGISEARRILADENFHHYSIEGIAKTVGFSSKSTFHVAFKKLTGLTPSYFRETVRTLRSRGDFPLQD